MKKRVAKYKRVSHSEQKLHGLSIAAQDRELNAWAEKNGIEFVGDYVDEGIPASRTNRPALLQLLEDVKSGKIDLIVFTKLDRWFRSVAQYYKIQEVLDSNNVYWKTILEDYNTETADGQFKVNIMLSVAQNEIGRTSERIKTVFNYKLANKQALTGAQPYGYIIGVDKRPMIDPQREPVVKLIHQTIFETQSIRKTLTTAKTLDQDISYKTVKTVLKSDKYTGYYRGIPDYYPPYINYSKFLEIQEILNRNIKDQGSRRVYMFTGLIVCPSCGKILGGGYTSPQSGYGYYMYRCNGHRIEKTCNFKSVVNEAKLEKHLLKIIRVEMQNREIVAHEIPEQPELVDVDEIQAQMERLNTMFFKGRISEEAYESAYTELENILKTAGDEKEQSESESILLSTDFESLYSEMSKEEKRLFWRGIIKSMTVYPKDNYRTDIIFYD